MHNNILIELLIFLLFFNLAFSDDPYGSASGEDYVLEIEVYNNIEGTCSNTTIEFILGTVKEIEGDLNVEIDLFSPKDKELDYNCDSLKKGQNIKCRADLESLKEYYSEGDQFTFKLNNEYVKSNKYSDKITLKNNCPDHLDISDSFNFEEIKETIKVKSQEIFERKLKYTTQFKYKTDKNLQQYNVGMVTFVMLISLIKKKRRRRLGDEQYWSRCSNSDNIVPGKEEDVSFSCITDNELNADITDLKGYQIKVEKIGKNDVDIEFEGSEGKGLSGAAIAGICIAALVVMIVGIIGIYLYVKSKGGERRSGYDGRPERNNGNMSRRNLREDGFKSEDERLKNEKAE